MADATAPAVEFLLRLGDSALILGHRLSEWCGHAPVLEEDIALANVALDLTGQAAAWLDLAGRREGQGRDADRLAYWRDSRDYRNLLLVEQPNGDFGRTIVRQFLFDAWHAELLPALARSDDAEIAGIAAKAAREAAYHRRHSAEWVIRLGDGTADSHARAQAALDDLWRFTGEMLAPHPVHERLVAAGIAPEIGPVAAAWSATVDRVLAEATLRRPPVGWMPTGGFLGRHGEGLGHLLAVMQSVARAHPGAQW